MMFAWPRASCSFRQFAYRQCAQKSGQMAATRTYLDRAAPLGVASWPDECHTDIIPTLGCGVGYASRRPPPPDQPAMGCRETRYVLPRGPGFLQCLARQPWLRHHSTAGTCSANLTRVCWPYCMGLQIGSNGVYAITPCTPHPVRFARVPNRSLRSSLSRGSTRNCPSFRPSMALGNWDSSRCLVWCPYGGCCE